MTPAKEKDQFYLSLFRDIYASEMQTRPNANFIPKRTGTGLNYPIITA